MTTAYQVEWKSHLPSLLKQVFDNPGTHALALPMQITFGILGRVAERCAELNDPVLNHLMVSLALYEEADPYKPESYNPEMLAEVKHLYLEYMKHETI